MSHVLIVGQADQIAYFRAYNTDGTAKTDLTASTAGLSISVFRVGGPSVSIASLSNKAADDTTHLEGAIRQVSGNLYTIDIPDAACASQFPSVVVRGSYTGGVIEGLEHPIVAYNPSVGYGTTTAVSDISDRIPSALEGGFMMVSVQSMGAGVITQAATDSDFVTMIQSGLATSAALTIVAGYLDTEIAAIKVVTDKVDTMLILDGVVYQLTANALELSPSTTVNITPAFARQDAMIEANTITIRKGTQGWILVTILDENDDPVNLTVYTGLKFLVSVPGATSLQEQTVNVIGTDNNQFYWKPNAASTSKERSLVWSLVNDIVDESSQYYKASPADGIILVKDTAVL